MYTYPQGHVAAVTCHAEYCADIGVTYPIDSELNCTGVNVSCETSQP